MQTPAIKNVAIEKTGRFWSVTVNNQMLAMVLYKRGALAVQQLVSSLAGLPIPEEKPATTENSPHPVPSTSEETTVVDAPPTPQKPATAKSKSTETKVKKTTTSKSSKKG